MSIFDVEAPGSTQELRSSLRHLHSEATALLREFSDQELLAPQGEHWSPADHLRHLVTAIRAVNLGMSMPRILLALRFGVSFKGSRSFDQVRDLYQAALAAGGKASGRYDPANRRIDTELRDWRVRLMKRWDRAGEELDSAIGSWGDLALDHHRAKHPLLGMMTIRELLHFTLYHNAHHMRRIVERRA